MNPLSSAEVQALHDALDDEYKAWATYDQVTRDHGAQRPFTNIRDSEARHIEALRTLFRRYNVPMPPNSWPGRVPRFKSIQEACAAAVEAEVDNSELYGRLMRATTRRDLLAVFERLRRASQERHLPAFRRCASGGEACGRGMEQGGVRRRRRRRGAGPGAAP